jgi:hypothetical protein
VYPPPYDCAVPHLPARTDANRICRAARWLGIVGLVCGIIGLVQMVVPIASFLMLRSAGTF